MTFCTNTDMSLVTYIDSMTNLFMFVSMPTHYTITCFGFRARQIDGIECGLFSNHAPLGQTTLRVGRVSV